MNIDEKTRPAGTMPTSHGEPESLAGIDEALDPKPVRFDAVLKPARRFGSSSFLLFMGVFGTANFIAGAAFILVGPALAFSVAALDILMVWYVFRMSFGAPRRVETVRLTDDALTVLRVTRGGKRQSYRFHPYWLQVELDDPPQPDSPLVLRSHGDEIEIGRFLTADEKVDFAKALRAELSALNAGPV
jgi:uncharacterized membrane protein